MLHRGIMQHAGSQATALLSDGLEITFASLAQRVCAMAAQIDAAASSLDGPVGLSAEPDCASVVALLAILQSGRAYVPVDPRYPVARLQHMACDSGICLLVIVGEQSAVEWFTGQVIHVARLDACETNGRLADGCRDSITPRPGIDESGSRLAYVIYTSGSTGRPKGVAGSHAAMTSRLEAGLRTYPYNADEVGCHKTSLNFIDSICEIMLPLSAQGTRASARYMPSPHSPPIQLFKPAARARALAWPPVTHECFFVRMDDV